MLQLRDEHISPVLLSLLIIIHEAVKELVSVLFAELLAVGLQSLHGLLVLLLTLPQVLPCELQESLAVDSPVQQKRYFLLRFSAIITGSS